MKIPTYERRARMTDKVASQPLNIQANSGAFEGGGQSLVTIGNAVMAQATWMDAEQKIVNANEVSKAEGLYKEALIKLENEINETPAYNSNPKQAAAYFELRNKALLANSAKGITGKLATSTFLTNANDLKLTSKARMTKIARARLVSKSIEEAQIKANTLENELAELEPGSSQYKKKEDELYGRGNKEGVFDSMVMKGIIKPTDRYKFEKKSRGKVESNHIHKALTVAQTMSLTEDDIKTGSASKQALQVYNDIIAGKHKHLDFDQKQKLAEQALRLSNTLMTRRNNEFERKQLREKRDRDDRHLNNSNALLSRIITERTKPDDADAQKKAPTAIEVEKAFVNKQINKSQYEGIIRALNSQGAVVTDRNYLANQVERIRKAQSKQEIEKVITESYKNISRLNYDDLRFLRSMAEQYAANTPRMKRAKIFGTLIDTLLKPSGILDNILPGARERAGLVKTNFDIAIMENVDPLEAFNTALDQFRVDEKINLRKIPIPRFLPVAPGAEALAENRDISTWTLADVSASREMAKTKFKGRVGSLATELFNLEMIDRYIAVRDDALSNLDQINEQTKQLQDQN